jgi:hypothetical protein
MEMKVLVVGLMLLAGVVQSAAAQSAQEMQSAAPAQRSGESAEQHGQRLLAEMVKALGGDAWLNKRTMYREGQTASFFRGESNGSVVRFIEFKRFADATSPELARFEFLTVRGMIAPGMKRDVAHLWTADQGYEVTYKGQSVLPAVQVADYMRRRSHSLEEVMRSWVKAPGVVIVFIGADMRDRRPVDKVSILSANNDAVTIEIDQYTHLPLQRSFEWRNNQFKDHDLDEEVYGDWRVFDGIATPMNMTTYRNGDMAGQTFYTKVRFGQPMGDELFDRTKLLKK